MIPSDGQVWWGRLAVLVGALLLAVSLWLPVEWREQFSTVLGGVVATSDGLLTVAFLDVGQGDSIYIETPDGVQLLIDGGPDNSVLRQLGRVMPFWDRSIDVVLATHSDKDHVGGLVDVLERYEVKNLVMTENVNDTAVADVFNYLAGEEGSNITYARAGQQFQLGASTTLIVYSPASDPTSWESNAASIVAQLVYGEVAIMLTGDASIGIEDYLADNYGELLRSQVLKLGHHGSKTSSGAKFLASVQPEYSIVSAGRDNRYGHPHAEVLERVEAVGSKILNTAEEGTIIFKSDGGRVWVE
jgi:competence protein ComEC